MTKANVVGIDLLPIDQAIDLGLGRQHVCDLLLGAP